MVSARLQLIAFVFPKSDPESNIFWSALMRLLGSLSHANVQDNHIIFAPVQPVGALPLTRFQQADVPMPQIVFSPNLPLDRTIGGLHIGANHPLQAVSQSPVTLPAYLSIQDLAERVSAHVTRLDHCGVNLSPALLDRSDWEELMQHCARSAALYRYPGEEWPFILPATEAEVMADIDQFVLGRAPKFEFVYADGPDHPLVQFNLDTDLSRAELEARFPAPEGQALPGLEEIFRTVYVTHPWPGVSIRFDLTYRSESGTSVWETGEWLVTNGERIRAA